MWLTASGIESARLSPAGQVAAVADDDRAQCPRGMDGGASRASRASVEVGPRAYGRPRAVGGQDALRARLHRAAARPRSLKPSGPPAAVIAESGGRREDRQKHILEGWRDAVWTERYAGVYYDCANASVAVWIKRLAKKVHLAAPALTAAVQLGADEIAALSPAAADDEPVLSHPQDSPKAAPTIDEAIDMPHARAAVSGAPAPPKQPEPPAVSEPETAEEAAERERRYREIFGIPEPRRRRPWRRSQTSWPGTT